MQFFEWMEYTEDLTFGHCEGNNGRIYECVVLGQYCESMKIPIVEFKLGDTRLGRFLFWIKMNVQKKILYVLKCINYNGKTCKIHEI